MQIAILLMINQSVFNVKFLRNAGRIHLFGLAAIAFSLQRRSRWSEARTAWKVTIGFDRASAVADPEALARFHINLATCECFLGGFVEAASNLRAAHLLSKTVAQQPSGILALARVTRKNDHQETLRLLYTGLSDAPHDTALLYEMGSVCLDGTHPSLGIPYASRLLEIEPTNRSFVLLAADLAERSGYLVAAIAHLRALVALSPEELELHRRLMSVLASIGAIDEARLVARTAYRIHNDLILVHWLSELYTKGGNLRKARLLCRFLLRRWPHSIWHRKRYAEYLAIDGDLNRADGALATFSDDWNASDALRALYKVATLAHARQEALKRIEVGKSGIPFDIEIELDHGYAVADVRGPAQAALIFDRLSVLTRFDARALHAIAHMAVRQRDAVATLAAWQRASDVHPDDAYALREYCRSLFESGRGRRAMALCEQRSFGFVKDKAFVEFYAWLSAAAGRFKATLALCIDRLPGFPNSWQLLESGFISAGYLSTTAEFATIAFEVPFVVATRGDVLRLYTVMRVAALSDHARLLIGRFHLGTRVRHDHRWLARFAVEEQRDSHEPQEPATPLALGTALIQSLYQGSRFEAMVAHRPIRRFEALSDPAIADLLTEKSGPRRTIHIFSKFEQTRGGSELHALDLAERLRAYATVELWAPDMCHTAFIESGTVRVVDPWIGQLPSPGGIVVLVGLYFDLGPWMRLIAPHRVLGLYNTFEAPTAMDRIETIFEWTSLRTELIYCSDMMRTELGLPRVFEPSPTDLDLFFPDTTVTTRPFTLGRHSRDVVEKHHPEDAAIYRAVSAGRGRSIVLGGVCMQETFGPITGLDLRPTISSGIPDFIRSLDCYFYRTGTWVEPWGRVVIEAMACGVPVVAHRLGGYAQAIESGVNGFLFDDTEEAVQQVKRLMDDPDLRKEIGLNARNSAEALVGPTAMRRIIAYYLMENPDQEI
ncbi:glycosyltransferase [Lichenihabitans psoromatis]|uniref:glycosyltransferase n=1 Tax=Lichenihabitans psoromatis TaxID=2528642 RepID=UPI001035A051|nr:glycosyltransferase [Lichenihabitans psoromatis]